MREEGRTGRGDSEWEKERRVFFKDREMEIEEVKKDRREGEGWFRELKIRDKEIQRKERWKKTEDSRYSK